MFQSELMGARYLVQVQETRFWEVFGKELLLWVPRYIGHMPASIEHLHVLVLYLSELSRRDYEGAVVSERRHESSSEKAGQSSGSTL